MSLGRWWRQRFSAQNHVDTIVMSSEWLRHQHRLEGREGWEGVQWDWTTFLRRRRGIADQDDAERPALWFPED